MPIEIIDLTNSPDSTPPPPRFSSNTTMILNFGHVSPNPNMHHQHQTTLLVPTPPGHTYETASQIATGWFQPGMHGGRVTTLLEPIPESNRYLFPNGVRLKENWTQLEHDLFVMGLIEFGKGRWSKIARHYLCNKTPQEVQSYALSFFKHMPTTYMYGLRRRKIISNTTYSASTRNIRNFMVDANFMPNMISYNNELPKETLTLLPPYGGEASSSNNTINYETFKIMSSGASTSMTMPNAIANGEVDLELRLGGLY